ncbi:hypothetical protein ROJ8625_00493 [Roseivivax jejudonensis]|uniref:Uncharacterized protein n=1 Tax=Roseivivax jejudonensis TaxID=1529041 RepID=A0A1X6YAE0_9RHOB|nr:hypothetical protein ROJ8625_00493 [Roseivivax jejudonensis]
MRNSRATASDVILKIVILFLVFMGVLGMFGKLRRPKLLSRRSKCPDCGRHRIGKGPCPCKKVRG